MYLPDIQIDVIIKKNAGVWHIHRISTKTLKNELAPPPFCKNVKFYLRLTVCGFLVVVAGWNSSNPVRIGAAMLQNKHNLAKNYNTTLPTFDLTIADPKLNVNMNMTT